MTHDPVKLLLENDPYLKPYESDLKRRFTRFVRTEKKLTDNEISLADFASGHEYFGLHFYRNEWIFREWAPIANEIYLVGNMSAWQ